MKKIFVLPLIFVILCGCAQQKTVELVLQNVSFAAEISYGDNDFACDATLTQDSLILTVTEPQEIKGLTLTFTKNGVVTEYCDIKYEHDSATLTDAASAQILFDIISDITAQNTTAEYTDENCVIEGKSHGNKYIFEFSPTGLPISLKIESLDLKIDFNNVTLD